MPPTPWPDAEVPGFRTAVGDVVDALAPLGRRLDTLIGRAIGIEDLADRSTTGPDMLACIDYRPAPDGTEVVVEGQQRMGAHSDYTTFTLLRADPVPGLQIVAPSGGWIDVVPRPDSLLLNVGDLLAMWTNDVWPSTLHRVVPMQAGGAAPRPFTTHMNAEMNAQLFIRMTTTNFEEAIRARRDGRPPVFTDGM